MSDYRTDEETVEQIQRWWSENGATLIVTIVVVLVGVFGWNWWQDREADRIAGASALYLQVLEAQEIGDDETAAAHAASLREQYAGSAYIALLEFDEARAAMEAGDVPAARAALDTVLGMALPASVLDVARIRLARLDLDAGDASAALTRLDAIEDVDALSAAAELRGDALRALGRDDAAREAYDAALVAAEGTRPLLEMKRDALLAAQGAAAGSVAAPEAPDLPSEPAPAAAGTEGAR